MFYIRNQSLVMQDSGPEDIKRGHKRFLGFNRGHKK